jgi:molybdopterin-biosynthesis enzyme MoeA-like protein
MNIPSCKIIIIGDEILSGKRQDTHLPKAISLLNRYGVTLHEVRYLPDDVEALTRTFQSSFASQGLVFSFGGIGATPDDYTREAASKALQRPLEYHTEGKRIIEEKFGEEAYPHRIKMIEFPQGASLIPNPFNQIPGFSIEEHYFLPGFPQMAWPMMDWVLHTHYNQLNHSYQELSILAEGAMEGKLIPLMEHIVKTFPTLKLFSLPHFKENGDRELELGVKGNDHTALQQALKLIQEGVSQAGYSWTLNKTVS